MTDPFETDIHLPCPQGKGCEVRVRVRDGVPSLPSVCTGAHILGVREALDLGRLAVPIAEEREIDARMWGLDVAARS